QTSEHLFHVHGIFGKEFLKAKPLLRRIGMQGEGPPPNHYTIFYFNAFNTPGNEVAPWSDIVGEYLKCWKSRLIIHLVHLPPLSISDE
ncbi:MAG: hypothetical protein COZ70_11400, partial [Deltaproteobacteria bacterium CG_4_8_14_3_um_filter_51_11]